MIVVNKKLAKEAIANAQSSGRVTESSCSRSYLVQALVNLNFAFEVRENPRLFIPQDYTLDEWSSSEIAAAETVQWLLAYLEKIGCSDIERLLMDVADYRTRHPDYPTGAWPYKKGSR